jgi:hypothetical protein
MWMCGTHFVPFCFWSKNGTCLDISFEKLNTQNSKHCPRKKMNILFVSKIWIISSCKFQKNLFKIVKMVKNLDLLGIIAGHTKIRLTTLWCNGQALKLLKTVNLIQLSQFRILSRPFCCFIHWSFMKFTP